MRMLLQFSGQPVVPTVVAYGEVMTGWDVRRVEEILARIDEQAEALARSDAEDEHHLRQSELGVQEALGPDADLVAPELDGLSPLDEED